MQARMSTVCQGTAFTVSGARASNYSSILWTASDRNIYQCNNAYTDIYADSRTDRNSCINPDSKPASGCVTAAVSTMTITINGAATASAGPDATICEGSQYTLSGSNATNYSSLHWTTTGQVRFDDVTSAASDLYTKFKSCKVLLSKTGNTSIDR